MKTEKISLDLSSDKKHKKNQIKKTSSNEIDLDKKQMNYFRLMKEIEKETARKKLYHEIKPKKDFNKMQSKNLTELIYNKNSKELGNYYDKNQENITLYGSSRYDSLPVNHLLKEMGTYKERIINNLTKGKEEEKQYENSKIGKIVTNYSNCRDKVILTPLAENEKERNYIMN